MVKVLVADDDVVSRRVLEIHLKRWDYEVVSAGEGSKAWEILRSNKSPRLALLDWMMPGMDGVEICERLRQQVGSSYVYIVILTAKGRTEDIRAGLEAGADDYVTKPYDPQELRCRLRAGERILGLESTLEGKVQELEKALMHVKQLQGLLPICMYCKKIRDDLNTWHRVESYIEEHSEAIFSHALCDECLQDHFPGEAISVSED